LLLGTSIWNFDSVVAGFAACSHMQMCLPPSTHRNQPNTNQPKTTTITTMPRLSFGARTQKVLWLVLRPIRQRRHQPSAMSWAQPW
jgi:hypothetical protein